MTTTYTQFADNAHRSGGQTQTEACAQMSDHTLSTGNLGWLAHMLGDLHKEANMTTREIEYQAIRAQIERVRTALNAREY